MAVRDVGDRVRISTTVLNSAGTATDPTTLTFKIVTPAGVTTTYVYGTDAELVKASTGNYYVDYTTPTYGRFPYRWVATGNVTQATEGTLVVRKSAVI